MEGSVRLQGGETTTEGNVEVCNDGVWKEVCDNQWDNRDATVVCRQLNHSVFGMFSIYKVAFAKVFVYSLLLLPLTPLCIRFTGIWSVFIWSWHGPKRILRVPVHLRRRHTT